MAEPLVALQPDPGEEITAAVGSLLERERLLGTTPTFGGAWRAAALAEGVEPEGDQAGVPRNSRGAARA